MKASVIVLALIFVNPLLIQSTSAQEDWNYENAHPDALINAVLPLPEDLREGATVLVYHPDTGERIVIRQGSNAIECIGDSGMYCHPATSHCRPADHRLRVVLAQ